MVVEIVWEMDLYGGRLGEGERGRERERKREGGNSSGRGRQRKRETHRGGNVCYWSPPSLRWRMAVLSVYHTRLVLSSIPLAPIPSLCFFEWRCFPSKVVESDILLCSDGIIFSVSSNPSRMASITGDAYARVADAASSVIQYRLNTACHHSGVAFITEATH